MMRSAVYYSPGLDLPALRPMTKRRSIAQPVFARTKAAINYLEKKYDSSKSDEISDDQIKSGLSNFSLLNEITQDEKESLLEVFRLESKHKSLLKKYYAKPSNVKPLYDADLEAYKRTQAGFSLTESGILNLVLTRTKNLSRIKLGRMWEFNHPDEIPGMVERNFNEPRSPVVVMLLPDILTMNIKEYYLDDIDGLIFSLVKNEKKTGDILKEIAAYFDEEEIQNDYASYQKLIFDSLKHLLYANVVHIV